MIRIGLPPPLLPRLRLHWHGTQTLFARQTRAARAFVGRTTEASRTWWRHVSESMAQRWSLRARAAARQRARLAAFEEKYEDLVDLLCWAAKDGVHTHQNARYAELRAWMQENYCVLAPRLRLYWRDATTPQTSDPFEALFASENVEEVIHAATGIENMMQTRAALDAYRAALEPPSRRA